MKVERLVNVEMSDHSLGRLFLCAAVAKQDGFRPNCSVLCHQICCSRDGRDTWASYTKSSL